MSPAREWFSEGIEPGTIISLDRPGTSKWRILEKLNEHEHQVERDRGLSWASTKLRVEATGRSKSRGYMRIYMQIPYVSTETRYPDTRATQATTYSPHEFEAYKILSQKRSTITPKLLGYKEETQDSSVLVPGGFITWLVWEIVPGIQLGDAVGAATFWGLAIGEREEIRQIFQRTLPQLWSMGVFPTFAGAKNLVWDSESQTLYVSCSIFPTRSLH